MKAVDVRKRGKHLRGSGCACLERLVTALDLRLFQSTRGSGTRGQGEHEEDDGEQVELVHFCERVGSKCGEKDFFKGNDEGLQGVCVR
jgi:hypothetical protein